VTSGSPDTSDRVALDAFVLKVNAAGTSIDFVARLGGDGDDEASALALSPDGSVIVAGKTTTRPFSGTAGTFQTSVSVLSSDPETAYVAKLAPDGRTWRVVAAVGTSGGELDRLNAPVYSPVRVAVDRVGAIYLTGTAYVDRTLPIVQNLPGEQTWGAFAMKVTPDLSTLQYSTTLGFGTGTDIALDEFANAYIALRDRYGRAYIAKLNDNPAPVVLSYATGANQTIDLTAVVADARYAGSVSFHDGSTLLGTSSVIAGVARFSRTLTSGVHQIRAVFHGDGPFDGSSAERVVAVN
jgi:hypothetical protein